MYLALITTSRCNAACAHCFSSCGPGRTEALPRDRLLSLMDEAAALSKETGDAWLHFSISGGEPFLDFPLLLEAVAHGHGLGADMSCVSNAYWASSDDQARSLLTQLKDVGLDLLAVSTSRFHESFVKRSRVERALRIAAEIGLSSQLKVVRTQSDPESEATIEGWARALGTDTVQFIPLAPSLREGAVVPEDEYIRSEPLPQGGCPASVVSVYETGTANMCCAPGSLEPFFSLGNVHQSRLGEIRDRFHFGGKPQILRDHGPAYFARQIQAQGHGGRLRPAYGDVCELCCHIAHDPVMSRIAEEAARSFELEQLRNILDLAIGAKRADSPRAITQPSTGEPA